MLRAELEQVPGTRPKVTTCLAPGIEEGTTVASSCAHLSFNVIFKGKAGPSTGSSPGAGL